MHCAIIELNLLYEFMCSENLGFLQ